jgi:hypothetical protein
MNSVYHGEGWSGEIKRCLKPAHTGIVFASFALFAAKFRAEISLSLAPLTENR